MLATLNPRLIATAIPSYALVVLALVAIAVFLLVAPDLAHAGRRYAM